MEEVEPWLNNSENSIIFTAHSQGNFFVEDGFANYKKTINIHLKELR